MGKPADIPLAGYRELAAEVMRQRAAAFYEDLARRRTVRKFSGRSVPDGVIDDCLRAAGSAPSGANQQPWHFAVVTDIAVKHRIREAAEKEERAFYEHRAPDAWLDALSPLGTQWQKPFLDRAPCLIVIFAQKYGLDQQGNTIKHYYVKESVGIATGFLITALHNAGLVSLTYTPSPMDFLNRILQRPKNERAFMVLVAGYPEEGVTVPDISRKPLEEIVSRF